MHLRGLTLAGDYIQARLKNSTVHHAPLIDPLVLVAAQISESGLPLIDEAAPYKRSKKRRMRGKKKKKSSANHSKPGATVQNGPVDNKATQQTQSNKGKKRVPNQGKKRQTPLAKSSETITCKPAPPTMNHEEFPTLEDKTVEWATEPEYMVMKASKQSNAPPPMLLPLRRRHHQVPIPVQSDQLSYLAMLPRLVSRPALSPWEDQRPILAV